MQEALSRWWPGWVGAVVAAVVLVTGTLESILLDFRDPWIPILVNAATAASLFGRRVAPLGTLQVSLINIGVMDWASPEDGTVAGALGAVAASANAGLELPLRRLAIAPVLVVTTLAVHASLPGDANLRWYDLIALVFFHGGPMVVGALFRARSEHNADLMRRAFELEAEQTTRAREAVEAERARIARELHDIVSHSIAVVTIQTQAVRRRLLPEQKREADDLQVVETTARQAMAEMRRLLGVLRAPGGEPALEPQPGLAQVDRLIEMGRNAGLHVALEVDGPPYELPPGLDLVAYRVVQEGLTNVIKHASARSAWVQLSYGQQFLEVAVTDDGHGRNGATNGGFGLVGMEERVRLYGGELELGPADEGGYRVHARIPVRSEAST
jgi:signal transduction histidine kinase